MFVQLSRLCAIACVCLLTSAAIAGVSERQEGLQIHLELDQTRVGTEQTPAVLATITNTSEKNVRLWDLSFNSYSFYFGWKLVVKDTETSEKIPRALPAKRPMIAFLPPPVTLAAGQTMSTHLQVPDRYMISADDKDVQQNEQPQLRLATQADPLPPGEYKLGAVRVTPNL